MPEATLCARCNNHIIGHIRKYRNNLYCDHCYNEILLEQQKFEEEKNDLYLFIKKLFSTDEIPFNVITSLDRIIDEGKKISGIRGTLTYYYQVQGNSPDDINIIGGMIRREYNNASAYFAEAKRIREVNATINIDVPPVTVRIKSTNTRRPKSKYKMEDL